MWGGGSHFSAFLPSAQCVCHLTRLWSLVYIIKSILYTILYPALCPLGAAKRKSEDCCLAVRVPGSAGLWLWVQCACAPQSGWMAPERAWRMPPLCAQQAFPYSYPLLSLSCFSKCNEMCFYRDLWKVQLIIPLLNHLLSLHFFCRQTGIYLGSEG